MKIYTRTGDAGETGLFGGARVRKDDPRVEAYGTIDELNAQLGWVRAAGLPRELAEEIDRMQTELFVLGAEVACVPEKVSNLKMTLIGQEEIERLEKLIDEHESHLPPLKHFILPSGSPGGAALHVARTVARRAERCCLGLDEVRPPVLRYLNRVSDYLFVLARRASHLAGAEESPWIPRG